MTHGKVQDGSAFNLQNGTILTHNFKMLKLLIAFALGFLVLNYPTLIPQIHADDQVLGTQTETLNPVLDATQPLHTTSRFEKKLETKVEVIPRNTVNKPDPEREID